MCTLTTCCWEFYRNAMGMQSAHVCEDRGWLSVVKILVSNL